LKDARKDRGQRLSVTARISIPRKAEVLLGLAFFFLLM
jgi:hypothetical protein